MPTLESLQFWALQTVRAQHPEWVFWSWFTTGGENLLFSQCWELEREPCSPQRQCSLVGSSEPCIFQAFPRVFCFIFQEGFHLLNCFRRGVSELGSNLQIRVPSGALQQQLRDREPGCGDGTSGRCPGCPGGESEHGYHQGQGPGSCYFLP